MLGTVYSVSEMDNRDQRYLQCVRDGFKSAGDVFTVCKSWMVYNTYVRVCLQDAMGGFQCVRAGL